MPDVDRDRFLLGLTEALEWPEPITPETGLAGSDRWDSLAVLNTMAFAEETAGVTLSAVDLQGVGTAGELYGLYLAAKDG